MRRQSFKGERVRGENRISKQLREAEEFTDIRLELAQKIYLYFEIERLAIQV